MSLMLLIDTCSDLPLSYVEENKDIIDYIGMPFVADGIDYVDDFGKTFTHREFYDLLRKGIVPSTAQINSFRFHEKFKEHCSKGKSVIHLCFSSGLSGTYNSALPAKEMILEEMPEADITVIDTKSASVGDGLLVLYAVDMLRNGASKDEIVNFIEENKLKAHHWFAVNDLNFLKKGGRISATKAAVGSLLNVKPVLTMDNEGKLKSHSNVRGRKKSFKFLIDKLKEHAVNSTDNMILIGHVDCPKDAEKLKEMVESELQFKKIMITELSATIASHVGPDMIGFAFLGGNREE